MGFFSSLKTLITKKFITKNSNLIITSTISSLFGCASIAAVACSSWYIATNYYANNEYKKYWTMRFELDTQKTEDPTNVSFLGINNEQDAEEYAKKAADNYSKNLLNKGISGYEVSPEYYYGSDNVWHIFINSSIPNVQVEKYNDKDKTKIDLAPAILYPEFLRSSRLSLLINPDTSYNDGGNPNNINNSVSVINQDNLFNSSSDIKYCKNNEKVSINLSETWENFTNYFEWAKGTDDNPNNATPEIYIIRDQNALLSRMNFILQTYYYSINFAHHNLNVNDVPKNYFTDENWNNNYDSSSDPWNYLSESEQTFAKDIVKDEPSVDQLIISGVKPNDSADNKTNFFSWNDFNNDLKNNTYETSGGTNINCGSFWKYIDSDYDENKNITKHSGTIKYSWMKEYVLGIITKDNYRDFFPEKNPNNESKDSNNQILVVSDANTYATSLLKSELTNTSSPLQIKSFVNSPTEDAPNKTKSIIYCCQTSMIKNNKYFSNNLFNVDALLSAFISIIFFISSVGIIVSFLYRVPGFFAFLFIAAATSLTFLFLVLSGNVISFGIFIGVFAGISMSFLCVLVLISRIKKYTVASKSIGIGVKKGVASSFLQLIDLHILCILIGVSSIYFGIVDIKKFGLTILLYSLVSFALINLVWIICMFFLFNNKKMYFKNNFCFHWKKMLKFCNKNIENDKKTILFSTVETFDFNPIKKISLFNFKATISIIFIVGILLFLGMILFFTIGVHASYSFYGGTKIIIPCNGNENILKTIIENNGQWNIEIQGNDNETYLYMFSSTTFLPSDIANWIPSNFFIGVDFFVENISNASSIEFLKNTFIVLLIIVGFIVIYSAIRLNITSIMPIFVGVSIPPIIAMSLLSIFQIPFDYNISLFLILFFSLNSLFVINYVGNMNNQWIKSQLFSKNNIKKILNYEFSNSFVLFSVFYGTIFFSSLFFLIFSSQNNIWFYGILIISLIPTVVINFYFITPIMAFFINLRYKYIYISHLSSEFNGLNYDDIDEQIIRNINKFKGSKNIIA